MTIRDVAKRAGVSVATVSAVINSNKYVSRELEIRVRQAIQELNYKPNQQARSLALGRCFSVAYIVPDISNPLFSQLTKGIQAEAISKEYNVMLCNTNFDHQMFANYVEMLLGNRVDGVIITGSHDSFTQEAISRLQEANIPVVVALAPRFGTPVDRVLSDDYSGSKQAVEHVLAQGRQRVAFIGVKDSVSASERLKGYRHALMAGGRSVDERLMAFGRDFAYEDGYRAAKKIVTSGQRFDAVFAASDILALGCARMLGEANVAGVPVLGFDNTYAQWVDSVDLSVEVPVYDIGRQAMQMLFQRMQKQRSAFVEKLLMPRLVKQNSMK